MHHHLLLLGATLTALILGYIDHWTGLMPNRITFGSLILALVAQLCLGGGTGLVLGLLGAFICAFGPAGLFFLSKGKGIGGGDVKAIFTLGAWLGPELGLESALLSFLLLFIGALLRAAFSGQAWGLVVRSIGVMRRPMTSMAQASGRQETEAQGAVRTQTATYVRFGPYLAAAVSLSCLNAALAEWLAHHTAI